MEFQFLNRNIYINFFKNGKNINNDKNKKI